MKWITLLLCKLKPLDIISTGEVKIKTTKMSKRIKSQRVKKVKRMMTMSFCKIKPKESKQSKDRILRMISVLKALTWLSSKENLFVSLEPLGPVKVLFLTLLSEIWFIQTNQDLVQSKSIRNSHILNRSLGYKIRLFDKTLCLEWNITRKNTKKRSKSVSWNGT